MPDVFRLTPPCLPTATTSLTPNRAESMSSTSPQGSKVKKTRRRLRLSCVECTKRRQKCDRNHPCGLCVSRGVPQLCRWETVPMARPIPSKPPESGIRYLDGIAQHDAIVKELQDRIASLEQALGEQKGNPLMPTPPSSSSSSFRSISLPASRRSPASEWTPISDTSRAPSADRTQRVPLPSMSTPTPSTSTDLRPYGEIDIASTIPRPLPDPVYESTSSLAQLCLAQHGEYIGRGSFICALHSLTARSVPRFIYAKSTDAIFEGRDNMTRFSPLPYASHTMHQLLLKLPHKGAFDALVESYFFNLNWRYGISRTWFNRETGKMWAKIQASAHQASEINANFLMLLFSILAVAPRDDALGVSLTVLSCDDYFMCAMIARRIAEDDYFNTPRASTMVSPADGTALGCLATPILASFLSERGRVSEAWKLVGNGIRNAQAVGLHRDPEWKLWQVMSQEEKNLRRRAWWSLVISERLLSYMLGRPYMLREEMSDVVLPSSTNEDGEFDLFGFNQRIMIELVGLYGEAIDKCFTVVYPPCKDFLDMDAKFETWRNSVPIEYQESQEITNLRGYQDPEIFVLARQRYILNTWYLAARLKLHIASTSGHCRAAQIPEDLAKCRVLCINVALELIKYQCDFHDSLIAQFKERQKLHYAYLASGWLFHGCFSLFEACIALLATKERIPRQAQLPGQMEAFDRTLGVLSETAEYEPGKEGSIATMAINVLRPLREGHFSSTVPPMGERQCRPAGPGVQEGPQTVALSNLLNVLADSNADLSTMQWMTSRVSHEPVAGEAFAYGDSAGYAMPLG